MSSTPICGTSAKAGPQADRKAIVAMLTIGMLGGMSWESSAEYYRLVNEFVRDRLVGLCQVCV
jgi:aspartate racemase